MPALLMLGTVMILILGILLISVFASSKRPYFRIIKAGDKYIIQYRKFYFLWRTYTIPNTGEPAVYYTLSEAEDMVKTLVERRRTTKSLDAIPSKSIQIYEYSEKGSIMGHKSDRL